MIVFVILATTLAVLALAVLSRPLWSSSGSGAIGALRTQVAQLDALRAAGTLGEAEHAQARTRLERQIVDAVVAAPNAAPRRGVLAAVVVAVLVVAGGVYAVVGTPDAADPGRAAFAAATPAPSGHADAPGGIEAMVEKLSTRLREKPDDAAGWAMLGRSYAVLGRHAEAAPALRRALELQGDDARLLADLADVVAMSQGRVLAGEPAKLVERALAVQPDEPKALSLAGTAAFDAADFGTALRHWERLTQLNPDSELAQQVRSGIEEARERLGKAPAASAGAGTVSGTVMLSAALAERARPEDTVFVFARAAEGSRMPLAALRRQVKDLPFTFTLDDSMAMSPQARLSGAARVVVGARVSRDGAAAAQPGDLQGLSAPVAPGANGVKIEIAEVVGRP